MRIAITLFALLQSLLLFSQTADVTTGCAPLPVKFTPPQGATTFFWDFKDGTTSNLASPSNIFTTPGTYAVEFRNTPGGPVVGAINITVFPKPVVDIIATPESGCVPLQVAFKDSVQLSGDIQITGYSWVFGDGASSILADPTHTYNTVGSFTVSLEIATNYSTCNVTQVFPEKIKTGIKPVAAFSTNPSPAGACNPPLEVSFTNASVGGSGPLTYSWDFGNGATSTLANPPAQTYTTAGNFTVTLVATDPIGCSATVTAPVNIGVPPASFTAPDTVCVGDSVLITNTSPVGTFSWTFGPDAVPATSASVSPIVGFTTPGLKTVTLTVTASGGCTNTATKQIYADQADATFTVSPTYSCSDPTIFNFNANSNVAAEYEWLFYDGSTANTQNPTYVWTSPDSTGYSLLGAYFDTVMLRVVNPSGCSATFMRVDTVWRPNARFIPDIQHGCAPLTVVFADSSTSRENIVEWAWLFDDGSAPLIKNNNSPTTHTFTQPGEYEVQLVIRNSAGCIDSSYTILIEVGEPIAGDFTADKLEVCPGDTVQFTNLTNDPRVDGWHFSSESDRLWHCFQDENPTWSYNSQAGPLDVSLTTEYNGCFFTVNKEDFILVKGPIAELDYKTTCDNTLEFAFTNKSHDATKITWYLGDGDSTDLDTFIHQYALPGTYTVVLKAENPGTGCPISYDTAVVYATQLKSVFELADTICGGTPVTLDGSQSTDVNATCFKGYTWYFSWQRPVRIDKPTYEITPGPSGQQTVWLEVEDINGCKDTFQQDVVIYNRYPGIQASDTRICIPATISFTDLSTADADIVKWEWDFGDGATSTQQNPVHAFTSQPPGGGDAFNVTLRIEDAQGCPGFASVQIQVYKPVSNIITLPTPPNICAGGTVAFFATDFTAEGSNLNWQWTFGNGNTGTGPSSQQTYPQAGQFPVKLVFTEVATGCKDSTFTNVNVQAFPDAMFTSTVDDLDIICYPQNITFTNSTVTNVLKETYWNLGAGVTSTGPSASTVFPKGTFTVTMVAETTFGCRDTVSRSFTVVGPEGTFTMDKNFICQGDEITFQLQDTVSVSSWEWNFGDGVSAQNVNPVTHTYNFLPPDGSTNAKLVLRGEDDACAITVELPVNFSQIQAGFTTPAPPLCAGGPVQFTSTSQFADLWDWNFGNGNTSGQSNPTNIYNAEGTYTVTLIVTDLPLGCKDTLVQTVTIDGIPNLETFGDIVCPGDTALIGVEFPVPGAVYIWTPANLILPPTNAPVVSAVVNQTTSFFVSVTEPNGCKDVDTVQVIVPTPFDGAQNLDTIVSKNSTVVLPVQIDPNYTYTWTPPPGPQGAPPAVTVGDTSVTYTLLVQDNQRCTEREFVFNIQVVPEDVYAPNAFTPNGDGDNDVFRLLAEGEPGLVEILSFKIFNRWGQMIYEESGSLPNVGWDGQNGGKQAPMDVYVWVAEIRFATGQTITKNGEINLLR